MRAAGIGIGRKAGAGVGLLALLAGSAAAQVGGPGALPGGMTPGGVSPGGAAAMPDFEDEDQLSDWHVGVTALGYVNGSFMGEPDEGNKVRDLANGQQAATLYPGFAGVGGGGGFLLHGNWRGILGLDIGVAFAIDQGEGQLQVDVHQIDITMSQFAVHLPILFRAAAPVHLVRPMVFVGPEFVFPGDPEVEVAKPANVTVLDFDPEAYADTYVNLMFGLGFEFLLYEDDRNEVRLPLLLRGHWNPGPGDDVATRTDIGKCNGNGKGPLCAFKTEWEYQADVALGVTWYYHL